MRVEIVKNFVTMECGECGVDWTVSEKFYEGLKETKKTFYCPNGHARVFAKSTSDILREKVNEKEQEIEVKSREIRILEAKLREASVKKPKKKEKKKAL